MGSRLCNSHAFLAKLPGRTVERRTHGLKNLVGRLMFAEKLKISPVSEAQASGKNGGSFKRKAASLRGVGAGCCAGQHGLGSKY